MDSWKFSSITAMTLQQISFQMFLDALPKMKNMKTVLKTPIQLLLIGLFKANQAVKHKLCN